jgi:isopentenyl-diphosphate delta-isomerase
MSQTKKRKLEHIDVCVKQDVEGGSAWFEHCRFVPETLTKLSPPQVDTSAMLLGKKLRAPIIISAITGGVEEAGKINKDLASVAEELGIGFGVGSQRAMIEHPDVWETYYVRKEAPTTLVLGNVGAVNNYSPDQILQAMEKIEANAMCMHLNVAQELAQPEGDTSFEHCLENIRQAARKLPVIAKETGCGVNKKNALELKEASVKAIDVGGFGGTNWVKVEQIRKGTKQSPEDWGIPTAASILECRVGVPLIATGGVRSGMDVAKAIALGADAGGVALPVLRWYYEGGKERVREGLGQWITELKAVMTLTGSPDMHSLKSANLVVTGPLFEWCQARNIDVSSLGSRR